MYIIIDLTTTKCYKHNGDYPIMFVEHLVRQHHKVTVISTYSDTIKYNFKLDNDGDLSSEHDEVTID